MASSKTPPVRSGANIATAAAKARSAIQDLQAKLTEVSHFASAAPSAEQPGERPESEEELERQLEAYFARSSPSHAPTATGSNSRTPTLAELRSRVIDGVVERILNEWARGHSSSGGAGLENEVMERLIERVLHEVKTVREPFKTGLRG